jgi:hypothetical protein
MKALVLALMCCSAFAGDLPDRTATPGAINPNVTQANIKKTVCVPNFTKTIRPPASYTNKLKAQQLKSGPYKSSEALNVFEEDHLIPLVLGGNPTDPKNLWPQRWTGKNGAHRKDVLEVKLHKLTCAGRVPLKEAQQAIRTDWIKALDKYGAMR